MILPLDYLRDVEHGQDIYVIAAGKSVDYIAPEFIDNKIAIGINEVWRRFPKCRYLIRKELGGLREALTQTDSHLIVSRLNYGSAEPNSLEGVRDYYVFDHKINDEAVHLDELDSGRIIVSWSTVTSAIHVAYYMGAKNIILIGHDCGALDGEVNMTGYWPCDKREYLEWLRKIHDHTQTLVDEIRRRGVGVYSINPFFSLRLEGHRFEE